MNLTLGFLPEQHKKDSFHGDVTNLSSASSNYDYDDYYLFDNVKVQIVLFLLFSVVFVFCFFGNLTILLVMALHWKMRSITKFCLGNLAFANFCVGTFCIYQNLTVYIIDRWIFGDFFCKMFHFINSLSHTASILILVVISVERYFVILHPFKCRRILTINRLRVGFREFSLFACEPDIEFLQAVVSRLVILERLMILTILFVWILSGILSSPRLLYVVLIDNTRYTKAGEVIRYDVICSLGANNLFASKTAEMLQFILLFLLPLTIISILYYKIGLHLRQHVFLGNVLTRNIPAPKIVPALNNNQFISPNKKSLRKSKKEFSSLPQQVSIICNTNPDIRKVTATGRVTTQARPGHAIKLLLIIVISFGICNFPFHLRKIYQNYVYRIEWESDFDEIATPITFLLMYANCAINPIVYAFMSRSFRSCLVDVIKCNLKKPVHH